MARYPRCALVVEPDDSARTELTSALESLSIQTSGASKAERAMQFLPLAFDLMLVSADLPDGALELVEAAFTLRQPPTIVVTGIRPNPACVFELAKAGARAYLTAPVNAAAVHACLCGFSVSSHLMKSLRPLIGHVGMKEIQSQVRHALLHGALTRSNGSRRSAAQLLGVTRPAIQKWLRTLSAGELSPTDTC